MTEKDEVQFTIESAQEQIVRTGRFDQVLAMEEAVKMLFRHPAKRMLIPAFKGSCPAFEYWVDRLKKGERLPRGKYFQACELIREN